MRQAGLLGGAHRQLAGHLVERRRHRQHDRLPGEQSSRARAPSWRPTPRAGAADSAGWPRPARLWRPRPARPTAGSAPCDRRRRGRATTSPTRPAGPAHARPARAPARRPDTRASAVPRQRRRCRAAARALPAGRETTAACGAAASSPGATSCGTRRYAAVGCRLRPPARVEIDIGDRRVGRAQVDADRIATSASGVVQFEQCVKIDLSSSTAPRTRTHYAARFRSQFSIPLSPRLAC